MATKALAGPSPTSGREHAHPAKAWPRRSGAPTSLSTCRTRRRSEDARRCSRFLRDLEPPPSSMGGRPAAGRPSSTSALSVVGTDRPDRRAATSAPSSPRSKLIEGSSIPLLPSCTPRSSSSSAGPHRRRGHLSATTVRLPPVLIQPIARQTTSPPRSARVAVGKPLNGIVRDRRDPEALQVRRTSSARGLPRPNTTPRQVIADPGAR